MVITILYLEPDINQNQVHFMLFKHMKTYCDEVVREGEICFDAFFLIWDQFQSIDSGIRVGQCLPHMYRPLYSLVSAFLNRNCVLDRICTDKERWMR